MRNFHCACAHVLPVLFKNLLLVRSTFTVHLYRIFSVISCSYSVLPSNRPSEMATKVVPEDFNVEELCDFLSNSTELSEDAVAKFRTHRISGSILFELYRRS